MALHAEAAHERLGAVVARPHAHAELVEHLGQVVGVDVAVADREHAAAVAAGRRAEDAAVVAEAVAEGVERVGGEEPLVGDASAPCRPPLEVVDGGAASPTASAIGGVPASKRHGGSAGAKRSRRTSRIIPPPPRNGGIDVEQLGAAPTARRCPVGPEHLVRGEGQEVDAERLHVDRQVRDRLGPVDHHERAGAVRRPRRSTGSGLIVPSTLDIAVTATSLGAVEQSGRGRSGRAAPSPSIGR